ncbi:hypothetical protein [Tautonia marina]|uniref:hypothetical protein n=1 Tax=Tautonia marina TaxID=2653855 RepID=UPI001260A4D7|nr:hypothetical protein [Tautonia marina]
MSHAPISGEHSHPQPTSKSGPRTEAGRRRSRLNAKKHGLTAALPDGEAEAALMQGFSDRWVAQLGADTEAEEAIIRASAVAYARLERCRKVEEATVKDAGRRAIDAWEKRRQRGARKVAQGLAKDPSNTLADLEADSFGCEWLIRQWLKLDARLEQGIPWDREEFPRAMHLFGLAPQAPGPDADPIIQRLWYLARLCSGYPVPASPQFPQDPVSGRIALRTMIAEELDRLEALRDDAWHDHDQAEALSVAQMAQIDTSKEGQLRQRYRREAYSEMVRGINQLMRLRVERSKDQDRQWHQAHPEFGRRRVAPTGPTRAGFPNVAPPSPPPNPEPEPTHSPNPPSATNAPASSRNEPQFPAPEHNPDRPNSLQNNEIRPEPSQPSSADDWRTEPRPTPPRASESEPQRPADAASPPPELRR